MPDAPSTPTSTRGGRPITTLLDRLSGVREVAPGRWRAMCPAHDGRRPALAITETADGTVLLHCFAGCAVADVAAAVGLDLADLFPRLPPHLHGMRPIKRRFISAQMLSVLSLELLEIAVIIGAVLRRGSVTAAEHARLHRSIIRILIAEKDCHD
ncbi:hypothetical protein AAB992_14105 [Burkholderia contaminans]|uniref:hypothetical protein n=1 Tax=Burkholderia contaminans TaxID=488447 RepID=UPI002417F4BC|nr:hypothetical protein [Burkholderia contaminans]WFN14393.1 hypothetical protein LXE92_36410 [Burkholderia contaminans]